jgi:hypothetical protein
MELNRFKQLLESQMGNVRPLITEDFSEQMTGGTKTNQVSGGTKTNQVSGGTKTNQEIKEDKKESMIEKIKRKLKGISDEKLQYNMDNDLPWDWKGSKEGYYEKMEPRKNYKGSN